MVYVEQLRDRVEYVKSGNVDFGEIDVKKRLSGSILTENTLSQFVMDCVETGMPVSVQGRYDTEIKELDPSLLEVDVLLAELAATMEYVEVM